jgi:two-component system, NtrC family, response regulator HydG
MTSVPGATLAPSAPTRTRVLVVDDDEDLCQVLERRLASRGLDVQWRSSAEDGLALIAETDFDLVLTDLQMEGMGGFSFIERVHGMRPATPLVVLTGHGTIDRVIAAMRFGAYDFLTKPVDGTLLDIVVDRALSDRRLKEEILRLRAQVAPERVPYILGSSAAVRGMLELVAAAAPTEATVLLVGESGTGKELVARAIHDQSGRSGPFLAINCAALTPTLLESEMFGHVKGSFTDAREDKTGVFVQADGGTLFLDEIAELPLELQPKILRAIQERVVRPVGSNSEKPFDARIVVATNKDLEREVATQRFREDLFYRVDVVRIEIPPLRARGDDVPILAEAFLARHASRGSRVTGISPAAADKLRAYGWPGNVRELENCVECAAALARSPLLEVEDLPLKIREFDPHRVVVPAQAPEQLTTFAEIERKYIDHVLEAVRGNKARAASILGIDLPSLYRRLEQLETPPETPRTNRR